MISVSKRFKKALFSGLILWTLSFSSVALAATPVRMIGESAIPFTSFLSKAEFDQRFPGKIIEDATTLPSGWYVIYAHESLNYYFGPILLRSTGEDYLAQLQETVEAAVAQRPSIQDYRLELSYEPSTPPSDSGEPAAEESSTPNSVPPQPQAPPTIWSFLKRIFSFW